MNFNTNDAKWIWEEKQDDYVNQYVTFRQEFIIENSTHSAELYICADSDYAVWLNGKFIACGQYLSKPEEKFYDKMNTLSLCGGRNVLCVLAYYRGVNTFSYIKGCPGLIYLIKAGNQIVVSGDDVYCAKASGYKNGEIYKITPQLGFGYIYDARTEENWLSADFAMDEHWKNACIKEYSAYLPEQIKERPIKKWDIKGRTQNEIIKSDEFMLIDLKKEYAGFLTLELDAMEGTVIQIAYGEHILDGQVRSKIGERNFSVEYTCKEGKQSFTGYFRRIAGRYIQLSSNQKFNLHYAGILETPYPVQYKDKVKLDHPVHKAIYEGCIETLKLCMHDHYEDSPWREQALYSMDARNQALCGYYIFEDNNFANESIRLLGESLSEDGFIGMCAPAKLPITIPSFSMTWIISVWEYVLYSHDLNSGKYYLNIIKKMLSKIEEYFEDNLIKAPQGNQYWNFYDWAEGLDGSKQLDAEQYDAPLNMFFCMAIQHAILLAKACDEDVWAVKYEKKLKIIVNTVHQKFWNDEKKLYATYAYQETQAHYAELTQALALCVGICDKTFAPKLRESLVGGGLVEMTLSYSIFKFEALLQDKEKYLDWVLNVIEKQWGSMLQQGTSTFWETINGADDFNGAGSLCHGWSAIPLYIYHAYVLKDIIKH